MGKRQAHHKDGFRLPARPVPALATSPALLPLAAQARPAPGPERSKIRTTMPGVRVLVLLIVLERRTQFVAATASTTPAAPSINSLVSRRLVSRQALWLR